MGSSQVSDCTEIEQRLRKPDLSTLNVNLLYSPLGCTVLFLSAFPIAQIIIGKWSTKVFSIHELNKFTILKTLKILGTLKCVKSGKRSKVSLYVLNVWSLGINTISF